eukprot:TRINITY_DN10104_c5_g1_i2.p1 TRINITY_DN10104_c5_g1~~TRINITY_DN10104_c5_g1_i2.p1  ORF type:complete len:323 (+),score=65.21 TRINITY_DN10104_c5_g1_i2:74-970(+)
MRVNQLDALTIDNEVRIILLSQIKVIVKFFKKKWFDKISPELEAILGFLLWRLSIWPMGATYGDRLQNLVYRSEYKANLTKTGYKNEGVNLNEFGNGSLRATKTQKFLWLILGVGGKYLWTRTERFIAHDVFSDELEENSWKYKIYQLMKKIELLYKLFTVINFVVFLFDGKYVSLLDRILWMRLVTSRKTLSRFVSFEYLNRQLVWQGFTEFLLFLMPLINIVKIKKYLKSMFSTQTVSEFKDDCCPICMSSPINTPYLTQCNHTFCYYCIKVQLMQEEDHNCVRCNQKITSIRRLN